MQYSIQVGCPRSKIFGEMDDELVGLLYNQLKFYPDSAGYMAASSAKWDGSFRQFDPNARTFPTGMVDRVRHYVEMMGHDVIIRGRNVVASGELPEGLYDYQEEACDVLSHNHWGILDSPPRSGKTAMACADIAMWNLRPVVVIVPSAVTVTPARQIRDEVSKWLGIHAGFIGDGEFDPQDVTVITSAAAYSALLRGKVIRSVSTKEKSKEKPTEFHKETVELLTSCKHLVYDEVHHVKAPMEQAVLKAMKNTVVRRGLSGTPWDEGGWGFMLEASCGPIVHTISRKLLLDRGYRVRKEVQMVRLPVKRYTSQTHYQSIYKDYIVDSEIRNKYIVDWARDGADFGYSVLIMVAHTRHGNNIAAMMPEAVEVYGSMKGKDRQETLQAFRDKKIMVVISTVMDEAVDIPSLDCVVNAAGGKDGRVAQQRADRAATRYPGKEVCYQLDFLDEARSLREHARTRLRNYTSDETCTVEVESI